MPMKFMRKGKKGLSGRFTLIELLVCIAIIAVLMTMLLPTLYRAKQLAYRISCMNNLKQFGLSFSSYTDDNDGFWPPFMYIFSPGKSGNWLIFVNPPPGQVKKGTIKGGIDYTLIPLYLCPGDDEPMLKDFFDGEGTEYEDVAISYSYNLLLYTEEIRAFKLRKPDSLVVLFDARSFIQHQGKWDANPDFYREVLRERHNDGANHLFGDFHVEWKPDIYDENLIPVEQ